jgi:hypothetical protein
MPMAAPTEWEEWEVRRGPRGQGAPRAIEHQSYVRPPYGGEAMQPVAMRLNPSWW